MAEPLRVFLVVGELSGDQLGAGLMRSLRARLDGAVAFEGVGGHAMEAEGLRSMFPLEDIMAFGIGSVLAKLPTIVRRLYQIVAAVERSRPDVLVVVDAPDFNHPLARRAKRRLPDLPIVNYVSPSVWAWRPGRAPKMRRYIAHVLALKPFEPAAHLRLGGPPCTYVGHPLVERLAQLRPRADERAAVTAEPLPIVVLPGSRRSEIARLMEPFGQALGLLGARAGRTLEVTIPAVPHLVSAIRAAAETWPVRPTIVEGEVAKHAAFRRAALALAASGTVTLELALSGVPMVVAYRVSKLEEQYKYLIKVDTIVLANLILGENVIPERVQWDCTPDKLTDALMPLLVDGPERRAQLAAFGRLDGIMEVGAGESPSDRAAGVVLDVVARARAPTKKQGRGLA